ncbi:uncharacterized protein LOC116001673 [Ipomoea triloba]|uniref:uncharacterized protein LOC116001673 n=1 Tax=Ipomoea triloba TaxID=35885 RepID=UPI00125CF065|nr:uncharacterized protein LOC116001673 [Ipomoea triloba]
MADSSAPDSSLPDSSNSSPPNYSLPDSSMNDLIVKLAEERAASLPENMWLSSKPPSIWNLGKKSIDTIRTKKPEEYKIIVDICKLALNHYQESHTDKLYEFDSVPEGEEILTRMIGFMTYIFKFRAKNMKVTGNPLEVFQVTADQLRGGALIIQECTLLE